MFKEFLKFLVFFVSMAIIVTVGLNACNDGEDEIKPLTQKEAQALQASPYPKVILINDDECIVYIGNDGHAYAQKNNNMHSEIIFHYPDCPKCRAREDSLWNNLAETLYHKN